jgi:hypothetical protein
VSAADQFTVTGGDTFGFDGAGDLTTGTTNRTLTGRHVLIRR